jgi:hypothetical protein
MKKTKIIAIVFAIILIPVLGMAANEKAKGNPNENGNPVGIETTSAVDADGSETDTNDPPMKQKRGLQPTLISTEDADNDEEDDQGIVSPQATQRRSRVSNAVQVMLQVSEKNEGIGQKIRTIAQNQNREMEEIEENMQSVKQRSKFLRFLIGPKYGKINSIEERLEENSGRLEELKQLKEELSEEDARLLELQIQAIEEVKEELQSELNLEEKGFALFGWLIKLFTK